MEISDLPPTGETGRAGRRERPRGRAASSDQHREDRFRALYEQHSRAVLAYALRRCDSQADAQDVLAETFVVAWRRLEVVPADDRAILWLYAVARRVLANQRRGQKRRYQLTTRLRSVRADTGEADAECRDEVHSVITALAQLHRKDREILRLAAWEGLSHAEIGAVLGCSENASAIRLHRARQRLDRAFPKDEGPSPAQEGSSGDREPKEGPHDRDA